jgi:hypothetical protein
MSLVEAMRRLLSLALDEVRTAGIIAKDAILALVDAVMGFAVNMVQMGNSFSSKRNLITVGERNS